MLMAAYHNYSGLVNGPNKTAELVIHWSDWVGASLSLCGYQSFTMFNICLYFHAKKQPVAMDCRDEPLLIQCITSIKSVNINNESTLFCGHAVIVTMLILNIKCNCKRIRIKCYSRKRDLLPGFFPCPPTSSLLDGKGAEKQKYFLFSLQNTNNSQFLNKGKLKRPYSNC